RIVSAAATNQSRSVATDASLPRSSASLASTALLISSRSSFSAGAVARCLERSPSPVWFALAGAELRANLGLSMPMLHMQPIGAYLTPVLRPSSLTLNANDMGPDHPLRRSALTYHHWFLSSGVWFKYWAA